jgi:hypothetical protein
MLMFVLPLLVLARTVKNLESQHDEMVAGPPFAQ